MATAYPYEWAETEAELERWKEKQDAAVAELRVATITLDTGNRPCRLVPVVPTVEAGRHPWWPIPLRITTTEEMLEELKRVELQHDPSRKSRPGFQRGLKIRIC
jgi:hypothetical protein